MTFIWSSGKMVAYEEDIRTPLLVQSRPLASDVSDLLLANAVNGFGSGVQTAVVICYGGLWFWVFTVMNPVFWVY